MQLALLLLTAQLVLGAPTSGKIDADTLLKNGQQAVALNAQWTNITATDACEGPQMACVNNGIATCINRKWDLSGGRCAAGLRCFALPNTRDEGISLECTSEKNALSLIQSTGAQGADNSGRASTVTVTTTAKPTPTADDDDDDVVTVTVTVAPGETTLPASTRTISPSDASKILASITATQVTATPTEATTQTRTLSPDEASKVLSAIIATETPMCNMGTGAAVQPTAAAGGDY